MSSAYSPLLSDESEKDIHHRARELDPCECGGTIVPRNAAGVNATLSLKAAMLVVLAIIVNIACVAITWSQTDGLVSVLKSHMDFRDTTDLPRPDSDTFAATY